VCFALPDAALITSTRPRDPPRYANAICVPSRDHVGFAASSLFAVARAAALLVPPHAVSRNPTATTASAARAMSGMLTAAG
jgi:hypothetical protein